MSNWLNITGTIVLPKQASVSENTLYYILNDYFKELEIEDEIEFYLNKNKLCTQGGKINLSDKMEEPSIITFLISERSPIIGEYAEIVESTKHLIEKLTKEYCFLSNYFVSITGTGLEGTPTILLNREEEEKNVEFI